MGEQQLSPIEELFNDLPPEEKLAFMRGTLEWLTFIFESVARDNNCGHKSCRERFALYGLLILQAEEVIRAELEAFHAAEVAEPYRTGLKYKPEWN